MRQLAILSCVAVLVSCGGSSPGVDSTSSSSGNLETATGVGQPDPPMLGIHWARGQARPTSSSADMTWHGGEILPSSFTLAIWWGTSWATSGAEKISGMDTWYLGYGGSNYAATTTEYSDSTGQHVTTSSSYLGHVVDTTAAPAHGIRTSAINTEVCNVLAAHNISPVSNGYYAVYTDTPRGHAGYCAWHSYGTCGSTPVQFAFFFNLDGDSGCDPQDSSGLHSQGLAAIANVSGHELAEAVTDPRNGGWYDSSGNENGDKCAWTFNVSLVTFSNGSQWKIQGEWSNNAYDTNTGYPNSSGQNGCLSGQ